MKKKTQAEQIREMIDEAVVNRNNASNVTIDSMLKVEN